MNAVVVRQSSHDESKSKRFGFGYEAKSADSPSVQTPRAEFLTIILETKLDAVFNLFIDCYPPFTQLLERSEHVISVIAEEVEASIPKEAYILRQPKFIRETALKRLTPNYLSLETIEGSAPLCQALESWALEHNLGDDWCLDDALEALRTFEVADEKTMALALLPDIHYLIDVWKRSWQNAVLERRLSGLHRLYQSSAAVEEHNAFSFRFRYETLEFEVSGPFYKSPSAFRQEVEVQFRAVGGSRIRGARKYLDHRLREYFAEVDKVKIELDLVTPPSWRKADDFFTWLVDYQLPPCKTYRQIAREVKKHEKTVREGIQRVASLIGLTLRSSDADKRLGRPKGARDRARRRRVDRRREKVRGNAS